ncbi:SRPBCC family protein [Streptomyces zhihengii]
MAVLTLRARGPAAAGVVWARYVFAARWPTWSPYIGAVRTDGDRIVPGLRGTVVSRLGISAAFLVESVDEEERRWSWRVRSGPLRMRLHHAVSDDGGGAVTTLRLEGPAPVVAAYSLPARWALRRLVRR